MTPHLEYTRRLPSTPASPRPPGKRTLGRHNLLQLHDVLVVQNLENLDLPDRRHGELQPQDSSQGSPLSFQPPPSLCPPPPSNSGPRQQRTPSFSLSIRTLFRATISPVTLSLALYTCLLRLGGGAGLEPQGQPACVSTGVAAPVRPLPHLLHLLVDLDVARLPGGVGHVRRLPIPSTTPSAFPLRRR